MPSQRRSSSRTLVVVLVCLALVLVGTAVVLGRLSGPTAPPRAADFVDECLAVAPGGEAFSFDPEQVDHAATIGAVALRRGLPSRAVTVALATAMQESRLRNVDYGDRDSLGLFQQRPSQGWGTEAQVQDPVYAAGRFYDHLVKVSRWQQRPVTVVAQAVQRSAFPDAYARWEAPAGALAAALTGATTASLGCHLHNAGQPGASTAQPGASTGQGAASGPATARPSGPSAAATALRARLAAELRVRASVDPTDPSGRTLVVPATAMRRPWAVSAWLVARASEHGTLAVTWAGRRWTRGSATWVPAPPVAGPTAPATPAALRITLA